MLCSCGSRIPDNVEYCPYCGKRQFIKTRPEQLTGGPQIESFKGDFSGGGKRAGCLTWLITMTLTAAIVIFGIWFLWQDGQIQYLLEWLSSLHMTPDPFTGAIHFPIIL